MRSSVRLRAVLALGTVLGLGSVGTLAAWSTSTTTTSGDFVTGNVDITVNGTEGSPAPTAISLTPNTFVPGQSRATIVTVRNAGTIAVDYTTTAAAVTGTLGANLAVTVRPGATVAADGTCPGTTVVTGTARRTASGASDPLCVQLTLSSTAPTTAQGQTGTATLTFTATGVASA
ncbi:MULTISPECIES: SipW-dependent-type signal peptide-containing protein [Nocardiaceae]|uniref:SipW-cognate class signal peptide n=1 Tax=Rhodococcoides kroppenstedtii TaxID=293050 RepID=A0ABS7NSA3_9NOCA|nr:MULTISPECIES: SipW-dependent-type signal peptide-containing protein [Rhodococcus]MBY6313199.1 hypothetical protein [Rhodococcus kroppenstedtii]MBY6320886.1 hypothetical protein [Rhodococcus kroppenstedtii]MBY6399789.1 hypothetical protein [Rhodococcus kroppenstedtii]